MGMRFLTWFAVAIAGLLPISDANADSALPTIDHSRIKIALKRTACFGTCPDYQVTIFGDGRVVFTTDDAPTDGVAALHRHFAMSQGVLLPGRHEDRIAPDAVDALIQKFRDANFFGLKRKYVAPVTDNPTQVLVFAADGRTMSVEDYVGHEVGMPRVVADLENAVDKAAGTDRWVRGSAELIPWLEKQGFNFHSPDAAELAANAAAGEADEATLLALIDKGAPLDAAVQVQRFWSRTPETTVLAGQSILLEAIKSGRVQLFDRLVAKGWLNKLGKRDAGQALAQFAAGCTPGMVDAAADAGIDIDQPMRADVNADRNEPQGRTALAELASSYDCDHPGSDRLATAQRLLARGANPNHRDSLGRTPLYGVENLEVLNFLLAHGADATAKANNGRSMVFGSWTDAIVLRLLEAGASPAGQYEYQNKTLMERAKQDGMPKTLLWLSAHPEAQNR